MILMLIPPVLLLVGLALGGRAEKLLALPFRATWLAFLALGAQWLLVHWPGLTPNPLFSAMLLAAHGFLVVCLLLNRRLPGMKLALVGALLNIVVMAANGGLMPVTPSTLAAAGLDRPAQVMGQRLLNSKDVLLPADQTNLPGLGDSLVMRWPKQIVFSIGDVSVATGLGLLLLVGMQPRWGRARRPRAILGVRRESVPGQTSPAIRPAV
jgi:hypothetical protein